MNKQQLDSALEELHTELQKIESVDEHERHVLQQILHDIQKLSGSRQSDEHPEYDRVGERLSEGIELFEASHPRVTMLMGQVADALAKLGI